MSFTDEGKIGIGLGLLGLGGAGAIMVAPEQLWIGWIMISFAVAGGVALLAHHFGTGLRERKGFVLVLIGTSLIISGSIIGLVGALQMDSAKAPGNPKKTQEDLARNEGVLIPDNLPTPALPAVLAAPADKMIVTYGSNASAIYNFPQTLLEMGGEPMIVADFDPTTKNLTITTLRIFDDRDDIIARIDEDGFWVKNTNRKKRPDAHTLVVFDHNDVQVLKIKYLNPRVVSIEGVFRFHKLKPRYAVITEQEMILMPNHFSITGNTMSVPSGARPVISIQ